jgi:type I restriction enzyme S subunit
LGDVTYKVKQKNESNQYSETFTNSAEFGIVNQRDFFDKDISNKKNLKNYYVVQPDDFVYNPRISNKAPVGPVRRNKLNRVGVMSPLYYVFRLKGNINKDYLEEFFLTSKWFHFMFLKGDTGARSDRFAIKDMIFQQMPITFPSLAEQSIIGTLLIHLGNLIAANLRQRLNNLLNIDNYSRLSINA